MSIDHDKNEVLNDQIMWHAVLNRDAQYRHVFVYAVRSTGIYCLPTCPSRRPSQKQVIFFDSASAAEAAGFRPCRRCHPQQSISFNDPIVEKAIDLIMKEVDGEMSKMEKSGWF